MRSAATLSATGEMVSHHGEQGPSGTGLFHWEWTGWATRVGRGPDVRATRLARGARHRPVTTMPDPLELDRPLRGLRVVDTTDDDLVEQRAAARRSRCRRHPRRYARPQRRRALRDPQRQQALRRPRRRRGCSRSSVTPTSGSRPATRPSTSPTCGARAPSSWSSRSARSATPVRTPRTRRRTRSSTRSAVSSLPAGSPDVRRCCRPASSRSRSRRRWPRTRALVAVWNRAVTGVGRPSRPLDPGGDDPDHRHAGRGRERASFRTRPADHQRGVHRRLRASRVPHRRRLGATAGGELPAVAGAPRVGR